MQDMFPVDARGYIEKQLEQLLQQVTTLRQDIASSRPMRTKSCLLGNNKIQRFAFDMFPADARGYMGKQLEQLLQQVTTLRQEIASSRPMQTKGCCKGNNYEQRFALDTFPAGCPGEAVPFHGTLSRMAKLERARFCSWLIEKVVSCCFPCSKIVIHARSV